MVRFISTLRSLFWLSSCATLAATSSGCCCCCYYCSKGGGHVKQPIQSLGSEDAIRQL